MTDTLRPPPYRRRQAESANSPEEDPAAQDGRLRRELVRAVLAMLAAGVFGVIVLLLRELPGGGMPYFLPSIWMFLFFLAAAVFASASRNWKKNLGLLFAVMLLLAILSIIGFVGSYSDRFVPPGYR
ncbi:MAG: hypothetical protein ABI960_09305 [Candidatus Eisenbacteria bacterium]